ncbi:hypothetical protein RHMOL_Rhmol11G0254800 [Rhododendron molle]|uniref:Uncharacterized protein n=1 Tax=Rhododendron molle TaxID=49168 RepID=A0ACC0LX49_RHOML|nr:hypothetical protein RHMOL_Rhmol11G0254800 [Rhododendron molle]
MNVQSVITVGSLDGRMENIIFNQLSFKEAFLLVNSNFQLESYGRIVGGCPGQLARISTNLFLGPVKEEKSHTMNTATCKESHVKKKQSNRDI